MKVYLYSGAGNSFAVIDGRGVPVSSGLAQKLCERYGTDGFIALKEGDAFRMEFYNRDGSCGMMCGNGGRCIVDFASRILGGGTFRFEAPDGVHCGEVLASGRVRLTMKNPSAPVEYPEGSFIDTGTRHLVVRREDVDSIDVETEGRALRNARAFAPLGTNVDFVERVAPGTIKVRTFEKGVEAETLSCGTGVVAAAVCEGKGREIVRTRGGELEVEFATGKDGVGDVTLTGPVELIKIEDYD